MLTWIGTLLIGCFLLGCTVVIVTSGIHILKSIFRRVPINRGLSSRTQQA